MDEKTKSIEYSNKCGHNLLWRNKQIGYGLVNQVVIS